MNSIISLREVPRLALSKTRLKIEIYQLWRYIYIIQLVTDL